MNSPASDDDYTPQEFLDWWLEFTDKPHDDGISYAEAWRYREREAYFSIARAAWIAATAHKQGELQS